MQGLELTHEMINYVGIPGMLNPSDHTFMYIFVNHEKDKTERGSFW